MNNFIPFRFLYEKKKKKKKTKIHLDLILHIKYPLMKPLKEQARFLG